jgi:predicted TIM-barrel fold metal-dependent hydrolase
VGRALLPDLRICFAAGAGLAPVHDERFAARAGHPPRVDPEVFVDTSSYGRRGLGSLIQALGIDPIVFGSDRPYAEPTDPLLGAAATHAIRVANPRRLLEGGQL